MSLRLPIRELRRTPSRFVVATAVLSFLATLLLFLGGLLDGLYRGSTGAIRAQNADIVVYSASARDSFLRSRITSEVRSLVEKAPGVRAVGGLGVVLLGAHVPGQKELADAAVLGYELAPRGLPTPPADGEGIADERLLDSGVRLGDTIEVGPARTPVRIIGTTSDSNYLLQGAVWVNLGTWRAVQNANRPDAAVTDGVVQALVVRGGSEVAGAIDQATGGATVSRTKDAAVLALPGVRKRQSVC